MRQIDEQRPTRNICTDCSIAEVDALVQEAAEDDEATEQLLQRPRLFFERRGVLVPPNARISIVHSDEQRKRLRSENGRNEFFDQLEAQTTSFEVHVEKGKGKSTKLTVW